MACLHPFTRLILNHLISRRTYDNSLELNVFENLPASRTLLPVLGASLPQFVPFLGQIIGVL